MYRNTRRYHGAPSPLAGRAGRAGRTGLEPYVKRLPLGHKAKPKEKDSGVSRIMGDRPYLSL